MAQTGLIPSPAAEHHPASVYLAQQIVDGIAAEDVLPSLLAQRQKYLSDHHRSMIWEDIGDVVVGDSWYVRQLKPQGWGSYKLSKKGLFTKPRREDYGYLWVGLMRPELNPDGTVAHDSIWTKCILTPTPQTGLGVPKGKNSPYALSVEEVNPPEVTSIYGLDIMPLLNAAIHHAVQGLHYEIEQIGYIQDEFSHQEHLFDLLPRRT